MARSSSAEMPTPEPEELLTTDAKIRRALEMERELHAKLVTEGEEPWLNFENSNSDLNSIRGLLDDCFEYMNLCAEVGLNSGKVAGRVSIVADAYVQTMFEHLLDVVHYSEYASQKVRTQLADHLSMATNRLTLPELGLLSVSPSAFRTLSYLANHMDARPPGTLPNLEPIVRPPSDPPEPPDPVGARVKPRPKTPKPAAAEAKPEESVSHGEPDDISIS